MGLLGLVALVAFVGPLSVRRFWPRRRARLPSRLGELEDGAQVTIVGQLEALGDEGTVAAVGVEAGLFRRVVHPCFSETTRGLRLRTEEGVIALDGPVAIRRGAVEAMWLVAPAELPEAAEARAERWGYPGRGTTVRILHSGDRVALTGIAKVAPAPAGYRRPGEAWLLEPMRSSDETDADVIVARFLGRPRIADTSINVRLGCAGAAALLLFVVVHLVGFLVQPKSRYWPRNDEPSRVELAALISPAHRVDTLRHLATRDGAAAEWGDAAALDRLVRIALALPCKDANTHRLVWHGQLAPAEAIATRCRDPYDLEDVSLAYLERGYAEDASWVSALHPSWSDAYVAHLFAGDAERLRSSLEHVETIDGGPTVGEAYAACLRAALTGRTAQLEARWRDSRYPACALLLADRLRDEAALDILADCPSCWETPELQGVTVLLAIREHHCAHSPEQVCFELADRLDRWAQVTRAGPLSLEDQIRVSIDADNAPPAARRIHSTLEHRHARRHDPYAYLDIRVTYDLGLFGCRGSNLDDADVPGSLVPVQQRIQPLHGLRPSEHRGSNSLAFAASALAGLEVAGCRRPAETAFRVFRMITTALEDRDLGLAYFLYPCDGMVFWSEEPVHQGTRGTGRA